VDRHFERKAGRGRFGGGEERGVAMTANRVGSMFTWFFAPGAVHDWDTAAKSDTAAFGKFFRGCWTTAFISHQHSLKQRS